MRAIKKGDILKENNTLRVVRAVHHYPTRVIVVFTIRRCSWTGRCYTVLNSTDLKQRNFRPTGKRIRLSKKLDKAIEADFGAVPFKLTCCDVEGVG